MCRNCPSCKTLSCKWEAVTDDTGGDLDGVLGFEMMSGPSAADILTSCVTRPRLKYWTDKVHQSNTPQPLWLQYMRYDGPKSLQDCGKYIGCGSGIAKKTGVVIAESYFVNNPAVTDQSQGALSFSRLGYAQLMVVQMDWNIQVLYSPIMTLM
ncbi:hypothetical protein EI94DRAFT_608772 [Lactarius quietus]|nr:hypothetical protein EI94DRAFT_608772 [Lactarius quietus]